MVVDPVRYLLLCITTEATRVTQMATSRSRCSNRQKNMPLYYTYTFPDSLQRTIFLRFFDNILATRVFGPLGPVRSLIFFRGWRNAVNRWGYDGDMRFYDHTKPSGHLHCQLAPHSREGHVTPYDWRSHSLANHCIGRTHGSLHVIPEPV